MSMPATKHQQGGLELSVLQDEDEGFAHNDLTDWLAPCCGLGPLCPLLGDLNDRVVKDVEQQQQQQWRMLLMPEQGK